MAKTIKRKLQNLQNLLMIIDESSNGNICFSFSLVPKLLTKLNN